MNRQTGFSLIELLVAMAITLVIVAATLGAFSDALRANEAVILQADMDQNLRAGTNLMVRDMIQAGAGIPTGGIPIPNGNGATAVIRPGPGGLTFTRTPGATNWTTLTPISPGAAMGPMAPFVNSAGVVQNGPRTDIINVLYADNALPINNFPTGNAPAAGDLNPTTMADDGSTLTVDSNVAITGITNPVAPGDLILFTNANGSALQTVTAVAGQTITFGTGATDVFNLNQRANAAAGTVMNIRSSTPPCPTIAGSGASNCWAATSALRVYLITYFLDATNALQPRLTRQVNLAPAQAVGEVIENLQLSYDLIDDQGGPFMTNIKDPATLSPPRAYSLIRKGNLYLAARSTVPTKRPQRYIRNNMTTQVSFRSAAFINRYP